MAKLSTFKGRKVLITGGSSGIGLATTKALSAKGAEILITARDRKKLKRAGKDVSGIISTYVSDVSDLESVKDLSKKIGQDHGKIDILINSAGIVHPARFSDLTFEEISAQININLMGTIFVTKAILPLIRTPGHIVNISSVAGFVGLYGYTAYSASKFGIAGFSEALRMELEPDGIGVSLVFPPDTDTPQLEFENRTKPRELKSISGSIKPITPGMVADSIIKGIISGDFLIFPDSASRSTYVASRMAGPLVRSWMDRQVRRSGKGNG